MFFLGYIKGKCAFFIFSFYKTVSVCERKAAMLDVEPFRMMVSDLSDPSPFPYEMRKKALILSTI